MTRREQLQEQYEDALFALLMDDFAKIEGERLLEENERLKMDPFAEISAASMKRCQRTIHREFSKKYVRTLCHVSVQSFNKIASIAFAVILLFSVAFAASENVRVNTLNFVIEAFETHTDYRFGQPPEARFSSGFEVGWIPEGFVLTEEDGSRYSTWADFEGPHGEIIKIDLTVVNEGGVASIDTEDATIENLMVNGWNVTLVIKDYVQAIVPLSERKQILTIIYEGNVDNFSKEEILRIVENITLVD